MIEKLRDHFDVVKKDEILAHKVQIEITKSWSNLEDIAKIEEVIKFLNGKNSRWVDDYGCQIMKFGDHVGKWGSYNFFFIMSSQYKCNAISQFAQAFRDKLKITIELGFPPPWTHGNFFSMLKHIIIYYLTKETMLSSLKMLLVLLKENWYLIRCQLISDI